MPLPFIVLIAGLALRFGVAGFNTLGDILIGISVGIGLIIALFIGGVIAAITR